MTTFTFSNVAPGAKTVTITLTTPDAGVSSLSVCGQIEFPQTITTVVKEFYLENFEESATATSNASMAHTGDKYFAGDFAVNYTAPNGRAYRIEYWYLDANSVWQYISKPYTTGTTLTEGSAIDDVRIYPSDAQMKSYTYTPGLGMTSSINESGQTYKYEYDNFGRLLRIVNEKGGVEKQYSYNYKTGN